MPNELNNVPFRPARWPFFYGWAILAVGTGGMLMSIPGQTMGVAPFNDYLIRQLPLTRTELSLAYLFGTGASGLLLPLVGRLYDRFGARAIAPLACLALACVLALLSQCDRVATGLAAGETLVGVSFGVMLTSFFLLRFFGQGVLTLVSRNMIVKWFDRHRGLAIGVTGAGMTMGISASPLLLDGLIKEFDWRGAWQVTAALALGYAAVSLLLFRDNPEACGLMPDGEKPSGEGQEATPDDPAPRRKQFTLSEALRTYSFWVFTLALSLFALYATAFSFHVSDIFEKAGMGRDAAFSIFLPSSVFALTIHLSGGWISDHVRLKFLLVAMLLAALTAVSGMIALMPGSPHLPAEVCVGIIIVGQGIFGGLFGVLLGVTWPKFYGREHLGAISGFAMSLIVIHSAVGPLLFSLSLDHTGSYARAGWACLAAAVVLLIGATRAENPQPQR